MKFSGLLLIGLGLAGAAQAQTGAARVEMLPLPETLPQLLFAPDPIAGTMLRPFLEPQPGATVIAPVRAVEGVAETAVQPPPAPPVEVEGDAELAEPLPAPETPVAAIPDATIENPLAATPEPTAAPAPVPASPIEPALAPTPGVPPASSTVVHVIVENVGSDDGIVNVAVCDTGLSEEGCPFKTSVPASTGFVEAKLDGIPPGTYAVVGYHDVNGNDEFDKFLGMPREPYALSSEAAESLVPSFNDAALSIREGDNTVIIRLKTFGGG
jgi:uncharacterized protein (DUF2141 family)